MTTTKPKCKKCNLPLLDFPIIPGDVFHFDGILLFCDTCGIITFPTNCLILNKEQILKPYPIESDVIIINQAELEDYITVLSLDKLLNRNEILLTIGKNRLDLDSAAFILDVCKLSLISFVQKSPFLIELEFLGFSSNPKGIWDIAEIKRWATYLFHEEPDFICFITSKCLTSVMITLINALEDDDIFESENIRNKLKYKTDAEIKDIKARLIILKALNKWKYHLLYSNIPTESDFNEYRLDFIKRYYNAFNYQGDPLKDPLYIVKLE